ncbi:TMEM175 family protein [Mesorhizobium sp. M0847]|uniref:TMEM175 family protein n=1 Tax=unclassified Mesorhizobium TaxID=325217 RepID=UPI003339FFE5
MGKGRVEAFTDGVVAIIITIMVLELKVPHGEDFSALLPLWPIFFSYVLSFINVGIYWNNLHNMFHTVQRVDGRVLWANLNLLFWLSLMPATTAFMGENHFAPVPVAVYGIDLVLCAVAYTFLATKLHHLHGNDTAFAKALGNDRKGKISVALYAAAVPLAFVNQWIGVAIFVLVAAVWFVPDTRFSRVLESSVGRVYLRIAFSFSATDAARSA